MSPFFLDRARPAAALALILSSALATPGAIARAQTKPSARPWIVAHRGASAYAPENTVPAFKLAIEQGADWIEFDLRMSKDGVLICSHDDTLDRTTDVEEVFPSRFRDVKTATGVVRHWYIEDFTAAELSRLDAGAWFDPKFKGTKLATFQDTIDAIRGGAGLFIELKSPELYGKLGHDVERATLAQLKKNGLDTPGADPKTPVLIQSFTVSSMEKLGLELKTKLPLHLLFGEKDKAAWISAEGLKKARTFATGLSPEKTVVQGDPDVAKRAKALGLLVTPYTFRASAVKGFDTVSAEMAHYIAAYGVDGVITDNPDLRP